MKILEIISFMNPFSDVLSAIFITTLLIASILVVIWLIKSAKVTAWEKNWVGENLNQNNLESDNGSIHELSEAIATKAEKTAVTRYFTCIWFTWNFFRIRTSTQ